MVVDPHERARHLRTVRTIHKGIRASGPQVRIGHQGKFRVENTHAVSGGKRQRARDAVESHIAGRAQLFGTKSNAGFQVPAVLPVHHLRADQARDAPPHGGDQHHRSGPRAHGSRPKRNPHSGARNL